MTSKHKRLTPFHLAIPVHDIKAARRFYGGLLGCPEGRSSEDWRVLADRLKARGVKFLIEPYVRFKGQVGEQATMFFQDPSGNALEFKAFADMDTELFKRD
ncbi:MAG: VOC family protein [Pseudomonadales bacterium]